MIYGSLKIYSGQWLNGKRQGSGVLQYKNGDYYEGQWIDNKINGYGIYK